MKIRALLASFLVTTAAAAQEPAQEPAPAPTVAPAPVPTVAPAPVVIRDPSEPPLIRIPRLRYANTWDVNLEAGLGTVFRGNDRFAVMGRGRFGALLVRDNNFWQFGLTAEYLNQVARPAFGIQGEYLNLEAGLWSQIGGNVDTKGHPGGVFALGLSVVGVEVQVRELDDNNVHPALLGKIRIPLGVIGYALAERAAQKK